MEAFHYKALLGSIYDCMRFISKEAMIRGIKADCIQMIKWCENMLNKAYMTELCIRL